MTDDYLAINRANWDARADIHVASGYGMDALLADPAAVSDVIAFDRGRLGDLSGLDVVHLQCHLGTDTLSLARLGAASVTGVDLSPASLAHARAFAARAGTPLEFVESDVYSAPDALDGRTFDLVYTGIGALCWLPSIARWADAAARLLRPGGRLFVRDGHPAMMALVPVTVSATDPDWAEAPGLVQLGQRSLALEMPYFERTEPMVWHDEASYVGDGTVASPENHEWNHGLGEIVTAVLAAGLTLEALVEHDSLPWCAFGPDMMVADGPLGEYRLADRPDRLPATFTLIARRPA